MSATRAIDLAVEGMFDQRSGGLFPLLQAYSLGRGAPSRNCELVTVTESSGRSAPAVPQPDTAAPTATSITARLLRPAFLPCPMVDDATRN